ncbi:polysaccharide biosynthesis C-terminal domain-containing protein [Bacteroides mediterraneensis]|uniref:polysaccharide biosynthesis C-terminal domain-containing protein n=1 Tax=Bacteroides mediterraneensis TaxID=1841856 RepID=UPI00093545B8|nr:WxcM-like domain-containing protein [Bacteroides mediterraneensis]
MATLKDQIKIIPRRLIKDERGWFFKAITGTEENIPNHTGEVYLTMGLPGEIKGGHYHPKAVEWFTVIEGNATLRLEDIKTHERLEIPMSLEEAKSVFVPNNIAHDFINTGPDKFIVLAYTDMLYDPSDTIAYKL